MITRVPIYFWVSNLDPAFAQAAVEAFEEGMKRLVESGARRRIFEYYGMPLE